MEIFYVLLILLVITRLFAELAVRLGQPPLVGEIISGVMLGIVVRHYSGAFPVLSDLETNKVFHSITNLGIFFLMLLGGIELKPKRIIEESKEAFLIAVYAMLLPLVLGGGTAWFFLPESDYRIAQSLFAGTALAITAVPVAVRVLKDLDKLNTRFGHLIVSAAVFDDVLSLILLAVLTALIKTGGFPEASGLLLLGGQFLLFFVITFVFGRFLMPRLGELIKAFSLDELEFSFLLVIALGFAVLAEVLGMHFILGAFVAGLFFSRRTIEKKTFDDVYNKVSGITLGFLAPVFFASIGFYLDMSAITNVPLFLGVMIIIAIVSKLAGSSIPAYYFGFPKRTALALGIAMSARGAVELIIADIANRAGLFSAPVPQNPVVEHMFSVIVIVAIITTILVPATMRYIIK